MLLFLVHDIRAVNLVGLYLIYVLNNAAFEEWHKLFAERESLKAQIEVPFLEGAVFLRRLESKNRNPNNKTI